MKKTKWIMAFATPTIIATTLPLMATGCHKGGNTPTTDFSIDESKVTKNVKGELGSTDSRFCVIEYANFKYTGADFEQLEVSIINFDCGGAEYSKYTTCTPTLVAGENNTFSVKVLFEGTYYLVGKNATFDVKITPKDKPEKAITLTGYSAQFVTSAITITSNDFTTNQELVTKQTTLSYVIDGTFTASTEEQETIYDFSDFYVDVYSYSSTTQASAEIISYEYGKFRIYLTLNNIIPNDTLNLVLSLKNKQYPKWTANLDLSIGISDNYAKGFKYQIASGAATINKCNIHDSVIEIPETVTDPLTNETGNVTKISEGVFAGKYNLKKLIIPQYVTDLPMYDGATGHKHILCDTLVEDVVVASGNTKYTSTDADGKECHCIMPIDRSTIYCATPNTTTEILGKVNQLYQGAFAGNYALKSVKLPINITTIGRDMFYDCINLETVEATGITKIPYSCFYNCSSLKDFDLSGITEIQRNAFAYCESLTKIEISASLTTLGDENPWKGCSSLESIHVDDQNTHFYSKGKVGGVEQECNYILVGAKGTDKIAVGCKNTTISDEIGVIDSFAFCGQKDLKDSTLNFDNIYQIGKSSFEGCSGLKTLDLSKKTSIFGTSAFKNCYYLKSITLKDKDKLQIMDHCFENCTSLEEFDLQKATRIEEYAFRNCWSLKNPTFTSALQTIQNHAFQNCFSITDIDLSACTVIDKIYAYTFDGCISLENVKLPKDSANTPKLTTISNNAFSDCISLTQVENITESVTSIAENAFNGCESLTSIDLSKLTAISEGTFTNCKKLASVTIDSTNLTKIGKAAFSGCTSLKGEFDISKVTTIEKEIFSGCEEITKVTLNTAITSIGESAFKGCKKLTTCGLSTLTTALTSIGDYAFANCSSLTDDLPVTNTLTSIGSLAFYNCESLTKITIPSNVTSIGTGAFYQCSNLAEAEFITTANWKYAYDETAVTEDLTKKDKAAEVLRSGWSLINKA